ncbi:MAG: T9SS type A sorting domain-containing protein, partial [Flavobacteriales bacterium]
GTSMSSPATAGVVALMLEANPELTPNDIRTILEWTAREDNDTGSLPAEGDWVWGHGKVTASQAVMAALGWISHVGPFLPAPADEASLLAHPNPTTDDVWVTGMEAPEGTWTLVNGQGAIVLSGRATPEFRIEMADLPAGIYILRTTNPNGKTRTVRIVKQLNP